MKVLLWVLICILGVTIIAKADPQCMNEFNRLLYFDGDADDPMNERAYVFYVSMAKHMYDLGNYQYCSELGHQHDLKYALLALRVTDSAKNNRIIYGGNCVPANCTTEEIRQGFEGQMEQLYSNSFVESLGLNVSFPDTEYPDLNIGTIVSMSAIGALVLLTIIGTIVDRTSLFNKSAPPTLNINCCQQDDVLPTSCRVNNKCRTGSFFASFSIPRNFSRIFIDDFSMQKELKIFNGIFVLSLVFVILNNVYFVSAMFGIVESSSMANYQSKFPQFVLVRLHLAYDIYYYSLGFTCCVKLWTNYFSNNHKDSVWVELPIYMYKRFIPMAFILVISIFLFPFFGTGPMYQFCYQNWIIGTEDRPMCNQRWWTPLIFAASVFYPSVDKECLSWLWIVSNEVIFFAGLIVIFYLYKKKPLFAYLACFFLLFGSVVSIFIESMLLNFALGSPTSTKALAILKIHPLNSSQGYVVGILFALTWFSFKNREDDMHKLCVMNKFFIKLLKSKFQRILFIVLGVVLVFGLIFIPFPIYQMTNNDQASTFLVKRILSSFTLSFERMLLCLFFSIFLLPSIIGKAGISRVIFGNRMFIPLARLNYSTLLVHGIILMWYFFGKLQILRLDPKVMNMSFIALTLLSYMTAAVYTLIFESPFITMESLLLCPKRKKNYEMKGSFFDNDKISDDKSDDSVELSVTKPEQEAKENSEKATKDSNRGSMVEIRMYSDNDNSDNDFQENRKYQDGFKKSNSLSDIKEFVPKKRSGLVNESEDSKLMNSFAEPLLLEGK